MLSNFIVLNILQILLFRVAKVIRSLSTIKYKPARDRLHFTVRKIIANGYSKDNYSSAN